MTATIILCILLALAVAASIRYLIRQRRAGKFSCGGSCDRCPGCGRCHKESDGGHAPQGGGGHGRGADDAPGRRGGDGA